MLLLEDPLRWGSLARTFSSRQSATSMLNARSPGAPVSWLLMQSLSELNGGHAGLWLCCSCDGISRPEVATRAAEGKQRSNDN